MDQGIKKFAQSWVVNTLAVLVAVYAVPGLRFRDDSLWTPFVTSLVLGIFERVLPADTDVLRLACRSLSPWDYSPWSSMLCCSRWWGSS